MISPVTRRPARPGARSAQASVAVRQSGSAQGSVIARTSAATCRRRTTCRRCPGRCPGPGARRPPCHRSGWPYRSSSAAPWRPRRRPSPRRALTFGFGPALLGRLDLLLLTRHLALQLGRGHRVHAGGGGRVDAGPHRRLLGRRDGCLPGRRDARRDPLVGAVAIDGLAILGLERAHRDVAAEHDLLDRRHERIGGEEAGRGQRGRHALGREDVTSASPVPSEVIVFSTS